MIKRIKEKLQSKKGGLKELLYDNIGIFIVGVLIVVTLFVASNTIKSRNNTTDSNVKSFQYKATDGFIGDTNTPGK